MRIWIQGLSANDASLVRGVGTYIQAFTEALQTYGAGSDIVLDNDNPDVIIHPGFFPYGKLVPVRGKKNILVIHDLIALKYPHNFPAGIKGKFRWFLNKRAISQFDGILTDTAAVRSEIVNAFKLPPTKVMIVPAVTKRIFYKKVVAKGSKQPPYVLYVGDVTWNKNLPNLARAVQQANVSLVLVGKALTLRENIAHPWHQSFSEFLRIVSGDSRFMFAGFVNDEDLAVLYRHALATVLPSFDEGFGYPWLESALQSTPAILSDIPVFREVSKEAAIFVNPNEVGSIASAFSALKPQMRLRLGNRAYKIALHEYSHERFVALLKTALYTFLHHD